MTGSLLALALTGAALAAPAPSPAPLPIGIAAMVSPRETVALYGQLVDWLGRGLGQRVVPIQYSTYAEMDGALERREVEFAFICSGPYVRDRARFGVELLAAPQAQGRPFYYAYVIVPASGPARTLGDLRGRRFAFTDPASNTGRLVPAYLVSRQFQATPESFFASVRYTGSHDRSIDEVNGGRVDGASVDSLIFDWVAARAPERVRNVRIIARSPPFGIPPFVAHPKADPALRARVQQLLLGMHEDPEGRRLLAGIGVERFVVPRDRDYDGVREMEAWLAAHPQR